MQLCSIAETISLDAALSTKLLKTVNSSFYGLPKTVGSMNQAVMVLGLNSVKTLALGFSLVQNLTDAGGSSFDHAAYWRRSLYSATAAKKLCELNSHWGITSVWQLVEHAGENCR